MRILNLQYLDKSDIKYEIIHFPDGENQLNIIDPLVNFKDTVEIRTRIRNAEEWFILLQAYNVLDRHSIEYNTVISYLMTQRNDRLFSYGRATSIEIIAKSLKGYDIPIIEPHNFQALFKYNKGINIKLLDRNISNSVTDAIMFPDAGAEERYKYLKGAYKTFLRGEKVRDISTGKITDYNVTVIESLQAPKENITDIYVVDDLCDGGGTFVLAYNKIKEKFPNVRIHLNVVHAVQVPGLINVCNLYDTVTVTNSYEDWDKAVSCNNLIVKNVI